MITFQTSEEESDDNVSDISNCPLLTKSSLSGNCSDPELNGEDNFGNKLSSVAPTYKLWKDQWWDFFQRFEK